MSREPTVEPRALADDDSDGELLRLLELSLALLRGSTAGHARTLRARPSAATRFALRRAPHR